MNRTWIQNPNRCANEYLDGIDDFIDFALRNGMVETYNTWNHHGEQLDNALSSNATSVDNVQPIVDPNEQVMDTINDAFPFASTNTNQEGKDDMPTPMDSATFEQYEKQLKNTNQELYPGYESFSGYEKIHACKKICILFYKENKALDKCPVCNESRFKMTSQDRTTKIPQKVMRYLPLKPRL
ncbi:hypothetical protein ACFX11_009451 [Malus domestica]